MDRKRFAEAYIRRPSADFFRNLGGSLQQSKHKISSRLMPFLRQDVDKAGLESDTL